MRSRSPRWSARAFALAGALALVPSSSPLSGCSGGGKGGGGPPAATVASITQDPVNATVVAGATASFTAAASCSLGETPTWAWQRSGDGGVTFAAVAGAAATYTLTAVIGDDAARFRALATCGTSVATSAAAKLTVTPAVAGPPVGPCFGPTPGTGWCWQSRHPVSAALHGVTSASATTAWATGDLGLVVKTTDGGATWSRVRRYDAEGGFLSSIDAADADVVWAVGSGGRILKTTDGGSTWSPQVSHSTDILNDVVAIDANTAWTVGVNAVLRTTDGGATWAPASPPSPLQHLSAPSGSVAYVNGYPAGASVVYRTADGGATWATQPLPGTLTGNVAAVSAASATVAWLVTEQRKVARTTDGATWTEVAGFLNSSAQATSLAAVSATTALVAVNDGSIFRTTDGGATWVATREAHRFAPALALDVRGASVRAAGAPGVLLASTDGGATFVEQSRGPALEFVSLSAVDTNVAWGAGLGGTIGRTTDGGTTWTVVRDLSPGLQFIGDASYQVAAFSASVAWATGANELLSTADGGATWTPTNLGPVSPGTIARAGNALWVGGGAGFVARSVDAGANWTTPSSGTTRGVQRIRALDAQTAVILLDDQSIRLTTDGGANWTPTAGAFSVQVRDVLVLDPSTLLAVGLNGIVRRSTDGGQTFTVVNGATSGDLNSIARAPGTPGTLWAGGFFDLVKSTDAGLTWRSQKATLPTFEVAFVWDLAAVDANVVWGTAVGNVGIFKTTTGGD